MARLKPPYPAAGIDPRWLGLGLKAAWAFNEGSGPPRDALNRLAATLASSDWGSGAQGPVIVHDATTDRTELAANSSTLLPTGDVTIVLGSRKTDGTNRDSGAFGVDTATAAEYCAVKLPAADGTVYWDYGGVTAGTTRLTAAGLSFGDDTFGFTVGPRGMEIWQNGVLRASNAANPTRTATSAAFKLGLYDSALGGDLAAYNCIYVFAVQLSQDDLALLTSDPAGLFLDQHGASRFAVIHGAVAQSINALVCYEVIRAGRTLRAATTSVPQRTAVYGFVDQSHALEMVEPVSYIFTDQRHELNAVDAVSVIYTDQGNELSVYGPTHAFTDASQALNAYGTSYGYADALHGLQAPELGYVYSDSLSELGAYTLSYGYTDALQALHGYEPTHCYTDGQHALNVYATSYGYADALHALGAFAVAYGYSDSLSGFGAYTLWYGYTDGQQALDAYDPTHCYTDARHALSVYDASYGYADALHALQAPDLVYGYSDSLSDFGAYTLWYGYTDGRQALDAYEQRYGYADALQALNAYEEARGFLDGRHTLDAYAPAQYGYTDGLAALSAYFTSYGYTDGQHALLAATELLRGWADSQYALEVRAAAFGYGDALHALDAYSARYGYTDGLHVLDAWQALYGFLDTLHALDARAVAYGFSDFRNTLDADAIFYGWVLNVATEAASRYEGFNFNSLCAIDASRYLGASSAGIHELGGGTDASAAIAGFVLSGLQDFESDAQKRVTDAYLAAETDGRMTLKVTADGITDSYALAESGTLKNRKVPLGRGRKGRYWQAEIANRDGAGFTLDQVTLTAEILSRRV
jgi:hypothetical protein